MREAGDVLLFDGSACTDQTEPQDRLVQNKGRDYDKNEFEMGIGLDGGGTDIRGADGRNYRLQNIRSGKGMVFSISLLEAFITEIEFHSRPRSSDTQLAVCSTRPRGGFFAQVQARIERP